MRDEWISVLTPTSTTRQSIRYFGSEPGRRGGAKLTNGTEVEEERQFSAAGQAGVGLAQLVEESMRACLQRRQSRHWCVFQQSGAEGDGLRWGTRLEHLTGQGANRENQCSLEHSDPCALNAALAQMLNSCSFVRRFFTKCKFAKLAMWLWQKQKHRWKQETKQLQILNVSNVQSEVLVLEDAKTKQRLMMQEYSSENWRKRNSFVFISSFIL